MIRKSGNRFSLGTNAKRLPGDHAQTKKITLRISLHEKGPGYFPALFLFCDLSVHVPITPR